MNRIRNVASEYVWKDILYEILLNRYHLKRSVYANGLENSGCIFKTFEGYSNIILETYVDWRKLYTYFLLSFNFSKRHRVTQIPEEIYSNAPNIFSLLIISNNKDVKQDHQCIVWTGWVMTIIRCVCMKFILSNEFQYWARSSMMVMMVSSMCTYFKSKLRLYEHGRVINVWCVFKLQTHVESSITGQFVKRQNMNQCNWDSTVDFSIFLKF